jgi:hypothetical protein
LRFSVDFFFSSTALDFFSTAQPSARFSLLSTDIGTTLAISDDICTKRTQPRSDRGEEREQMPWLDVLEGVQFVLDSPACRAALIPLSGGRQHGGRPRFP